MRQQHRYELPSGGWPGGTVGDMRSPYEEYHFFDDVIDTFWWALEEPATVLMCAALMVGSWGFIWLLAWVGVTLGW